MRSSTHQSWPSPSGRFDPQSDRRRGLREAWVVLNFSRPTTRSLTVRTALTKRRNSEEKFRISSARLSRFVTDGSLTIVVAHAAELRQNRVPIELRKCDRAE